jgi:hypothetical protein
MARTTHHPNNKDPRMTKKLATAATVLLLYCAAWLIAFFWVVGFEFWLIAPYFIVGWTFSTPEIAVSVWLYAWPIFGVLLAAYWLLKRKTSDQLQ